MDIEQDYIDLFSYARKGHMTKYMYMFRPSLYDQVIQQDVYYPFKMECELLAQKADLICKNLPEITQVLEIGPGSYTPIMCKTIPLLKALDLQTPLSSYKALDSNLEYAEKACQIIKKQFSRITTEALEIDFVTAKGLEKIHIHSEIKGRKLFFAFGQPIFANNDDQGTAEFLQNLGKVLQEDDYLLIGADTNKDQRMLEAAYNREKVQDLLLNIMYHLKVKFKLRSFNPEAFDFIYKWNYEESAVEGYLKPTIKQTLKIGAQKFIVSKNQNYKVLQSRRLDLNKIENFLSKERIIIKDIITLDNSKANIFSILIAQKNKYI